MPNLFAKVKENSPLIKSYRNKYTYPWTLVATKQSQYLPKCSEVIAVVKPCQYLFNHLLSNQKYFDLGQGPFTNYVDNFLAFLATYPKTTYLTPLTFSTLINLTKSQLFWTTYPSLLVNVVCERPLILPYDPMPKISIPMYIHSFFSLVLCTTLIL